MNRVPRQTLVFFSALGLAQALASPQANSASSLKRHWRETDSETIWTIRYTNCDYGYAVLLGPGVVAHDTLPPSPNHGFIVSLPEVGKTADSLGEKKRFIFVDATYDASDAPESSSSGGKRQTTRLGTKGGHSASLAGLPAVESLRLESTPDGEFVDESIVAIRSGIVYTVGLRTMQADRNADESHYRRILAGFRWRRLPLGECSNG